MRFRSRPVVFLGLLTFATAAVADGVRAHTTTDVVAVPAGSTATVTLRPTHGCAESPTIAVAVRAPVAGAVAEPVEGWSESSTPEGENFTVLEWTGGMLPADESGAFPVEFVVPDTVGELLLFPAVQGCEDGGELAWISGDPTAEYPAPRVLILAAGSEPAATIDDVPLDAPGRDQLTAIVDIDNPTGTATTVAPGDPSPPGESVPAGTDAATEPSTSEPVDTAGSTDPVTTGAASNDAVTTEPATTEPAPGVTSAVEDTTPDADDDGGSSSTPWIVGGVVLFLAIAGGAFITVRRRADPAT